MRKRDALRVVRKMINTYKGSTDIVVREAEYLTDTGTVTETKQDRGIRWILNDHEVEALKALVR